MNRPSVQPNASPRQRTAWLNVAAKIAGAGISFVLYIVLARIMTPEAFADVAVILAWLAIASALACFSAPLVLLRFVPDYLATGRANLARGVVQFSIVATTAFAAALGGLAAAAVLSGAIGQPRDLSQSTLVGAALLLPSVLLANVLGLFVSLKRPATAEMLVNVLRSALMLAGLWVVWFVVRPPIPAPTVVAIYLAASVTTMLACLAYAVAILPREMALARPAYAYREWTHSAAAFTVVLIMSAIHERIDLLLMGMFASPPDVAAYAVAVRFSQTVAIAVSAVGSAIAPHVVERLHDLRASRREELQLLVRKNARTAFYVTLLALAGFTALGQLFLKLFGPHYEQAYVPLVLLAIGQAIGALAGPAVAFATLAGEPRVAVVALAIGAIVNAALNILLVPVLAANGAALATAIGLIVSSLIAWRWVGRRLLLDTSVVRVKAR